MKQTWARGTEALFVYERSAEKERWAEKEQEQRSAHDVAQFLFLILSKIYKKKYGRCVCVWETRGVCPACVLPPVYFGIVFSWMVEKLAFTPGSCYSTFWNQVKILSLVSPRLSHLHGQPSGLRTGTGLWCRLNPPSCRYSSASAAEREPRAEREDYQVVPNQWQGFKIIPFHCAAPLGCGCVHPTVWGGKRGAEGTWQSYQTLFVRLTAGFKTRAFHKQTSTVCHLYGDIKALISFIDCLWNNLFSITFIL